MKTQCSLPSTGTFSKLWKNVPSFFPSLGKTSPVFSQVLEKSAFRLSPSTALVRLRSPQVRSGNPWKTSLSRAAAALILGAGLWLGAVFAADQALTLDELLKRQDLERLALQAKYQQPKATESTASEAFQKQQEACRAEKKNLAAKHAQELRAFQPTPDASTVDASTVDASTMDASRPPSTPSATAPVESGLTPEAELVAMKERALRLVREHHERLIDQNGLRNQKNTPEYHELLKHYEDSVAMVEQNFVRDGSPPPPKDAPPVTSMSDYYAGQRKLTELKLNDPLLRRDTSVKKGVQIVGQSAEKVGILVQKPDGSWAVDEGKLAVIDPELGQADKAFWGKVQKIKNGSSLVEAGVYKPEMSPGAREEVIREFNQKLHAAMPSLEEHLQQLLPHDSAAESAAVKFHLEKEPMIDAGRVAGWGIPAEKPAHSPVQANVGGGAPHNANNISVQQQHDMVELENYLQAHGVNNNKPRSGSAQAHVPGGKDPALVAAEKLYAENAERLKALQPQQLGSGHAAADQNLSGLFDINANVKELKSKYGPYASGISEELKKGRQSEAQIIADIKVGRLKPDAHDPAHVAGAGQSSGERPGLFDWDGKWKPQYLNEAILEAHAQGRSEAQIVADIKVGKIKLDPLVAEQSGQKNVANQSPSQSDSRSPVQVQGKDLPDYLQKGTPANKALNDVLQSAKNQRAQGIQAARAKAINQFQRDMLQQGRKPTDPEYIKAEQKLAGDLKQIGPGPEDQLLDAQLKNGRLGGQKSASVSKSSVQAPGSGGPSHVSASPEVPNVEQPSLRTPSSQIAAEQQAAGRSLEGAKPAPKTPRINLLKGSVYDSRGNLKPEYAEHSEAIKRAHTSGKTGEEILEDLRNGRLNKGAVELKPVEGDGFHDANSIEARRRLEEFRIFEHKNGKLTELTTVDAVDAPVGSRDARIMVNRKTGAMEVGPMGEGFHPAEKKALIANLRESKPWLEMPPKPVNIAGAQTPSSHGSIQQGAQGGQSGVRAEPLKNPSGPHVAEGRGPTPPEYLPVPVNPNSKALVPYKKPETALVPYERPVTDLVPVPSGSMALVPQGKPQVGVKVPGGRTVPDKFYGMPDGPVLTSFDQVPNANTRYMNPKSQEYKTALDNMRNDPKILNEQIAKVKANAEALRLEDEASYLREQVRNLGKPPDKVVWAEHQVVSPNDTPADAIRKWDAFESKLKAGGHGLSQAEVDVALNHAATERARARGNLANEEFNAMQARRSGSPPHQGPTIHGQPESSGRIPVDGINYTDMENGKWSANLYKQHPELAAQRETANRIRKYGSQAQIEAQGKIVKLNQADLDSKFAAIPQDELQAAADLRHAAMNIEQDPHAAQLLQGKNTPAGLRTLQQDTMNAINQESRLGVQSASGAPSSRPADQPLAGAGKKDLATLRVQQQAQLDQISAEYDGLARRTAGRPDGTVDTSTPEYQRIKNEYLEKVNKTKSDFLAQDSRVAETKDLLTRYGKNKVELSGSMPKNVRADLDLTAKSDIAADQIAAEWRARGDSVKYDPQRGKYINETTEATLWQPVTDARNQARLTDPDSFNTPGGRKGTGVKGPDAIRSDLGYALDNEQKLIRSVQTGDLKTSGKSVSKVADATGSKSDITRQAEDLRNYQDPMEAGVTHLGESPEVKQGKIQEWQQKADAELQGMKQKAARQSSLQQAVREELASQVAKNSGRGDVMDGKSTADAIRDRVKAVDTANTAAEKRNISARTQAGMETPEPLALERPIDAAGGFQGRNVNLDNLVLPQGHAADAFRGPYIENGIRRPTPLPEGGIASTAMPPPPPPQKLTVSKVFGVLGNVAMVGQAAQILADKQGEAADQGHHFQYHAGDMLDMADQLSGLKQFRDNYTQALNQQAQQAVQNGQEDGTAVRVTKAVGFAAANTLDQMARGMINNPLERARNEELAAAARQGRAPDQLRIFSKGLENIAADNIVTPFNNAITEKMIEDQRRTAGQMVNLEKTRAGIESVFVAEDIRQKRDTLQKLQSNPAQDDPWVKDQIKQTTDALQKDYKDMEHYNNMARNILQHDPTAAKTDLKEALPEIRGALIQKDLDTMVGLAPVGSKERGEMEKFAGNLKADLTGSDPAKLQKAIQTFKDWAKDPSMALSKPDPAKGTDLASGLLDGMKDAKLMLDTQSEFGQRGINVTEAASLLDGDSNKDATGNQNTSAQNRKLTKEEREQLVNQLTDEIMKKNRLDTASNTGPKSPIQQALDMFPDQPEKPSAPPEPPPDPNYGKKQGLQSYLDNMQNGAADTQQKMDDLKQQLANSHNSTERRSMSNQLAALQQTKNAWDQQANDAKSGLQQLGVNPDAAITNGATPESLQSFLGNMQNGAAGVKEQMDALQQQLADSHNSTERRSISNQLAGLQQTKNGWDQQASAAQTGLQLMGVNINPPGPPPPKISKDDDGTVRADGYSAGQLNNNNDQLQGQASGLGGEIAALQGQIFASHNTPEKQDLMNQLQAKLDQMQGLQGDVNANNAFLNAMNQGGGASVYSGLPASTLAGMEPTAGDAKNIKIPKVPVLAGVMGALDADHASQATTALANLDLQGKNVKANWVSYDAYNQIKNTLDAAGYQGHLTRAQAAQLLAQAQQANSWGSTIGNALVDSVQQGGTAFGQAVGGAAANAANTAIKNAVDGKSKPDSGSGSGDGSGNSNADSSGGDKKPSDSGGKNNDCNDGCPPSSSSTGGGQTGGGIGSTSGNSGGNSTGDGAPSPPPSSGGGGGSYAVFLLNNVSGGSIWVGSESDLKNSHTYDFHGGGLKNGDGSSQLLKYEKKSGDFATREEAMAAYKGALTSPPKTMPLTGGGQKAQIYGGNYWVDSVR